MGAFLALLLGAAPADASSENHLDFGAGDTTATFGANAVIRIDGTLRGDAQCSQGGIPDFLYPASNVYIVQHGEATGQLTDAGGSEPNVVVALSSGLFSDEIIGVTQPSGKLGYGDYDVVYDTCQDKTFDPDEDTIFPNAIQVRLPLELPAIDTSIAALKRDAHANYELWTSIATAQAQLYKADAVHSAIDCLLTKDNPVDCAEKILKVLGWKITKAPKDPDDAFKQAYNSLTSDIKERALSVTTNVASSYRAVELDPPDADYERLTGLAASAPVSAGPRVQDPLVDAMTGLEGPVGAEAATVDALVRTFERYEGAQVAGDADWALVHAREARDFAKVLRGQIGASTAALRTLGDVLADPSTDTASPTTSAEAFRRRVEQSGLTGDERRLLLNEGYAVADITALESAIRATPAISPVASADMASAVNGAIDAEDQFAQTLGSVVAQLDSTVTTLEQAPGEALHAPIADAGGPYTSSQGVPVTLDGSSSLARGDAAIVDYAWDLDGDGQFDDAHGAMPTMTLAQAGPNVIGLQVTDAEGRQASSWTVATVSPADRPPEIAAAQPDAAIDVVAGAPQVVSIDASDPDGDPLSYSWSIDGSVLGGETQGTLNLDTQAIGVGDHLITVDVSDAASGSVTHAWVVSVHLADDDRDGWTRTTDCDDNDFTVHPGADERIGNGIDDDCDTATPDAPPGGLTGSMWTWGSNTLGALGTGNTQVTNSSTPVKIPDLDTVVQAESAFRGGFAVTSAGSVLAWGDGQVGQLGNGTFSSSAAPVSPMAVDGGSGTLSGVTQVSADGGNVHVVARRQDGTVVTWGDNQASELGDGSTVNARAYPVQALEAAGGPPLHGVAAVEAGYSEDYALMDDSTVRSWGNVRCNGGTIHAEPYPVALTKAGSGVRKVASGNQWTLFLKKDGTVLSCGTTGAHLGRTVDSAHPALEPWPVIGLGAGSGVIDVSAGSDTNLALKEDGTVWAWGTNTNGELDVLGPSVPAGTNVVTPQQVPLPAGPPVVAVDKDDACHSIALRADGSALVWGCNSFGQVGIGSTSFSVASPVAPSMPGASAIAVSASQWNSLVLTRPLADTAWERPESWVAATVDDARVTEGAGGSFKVSLSAALPTDVLVTWALTPETASADDLGATEGSAVIPAGSTSIDVPVDILDDLVHEDDETFAITLEHASNGIRVQRGQATGTIVDNDAVPTVSIDPVQTSEGDTSLQDAPVPVRLSAKSSLPVTITATTHDGTAVAPDDYTAKQDALTVIPPGSTEAIVHIAVHGDTVVEPGKSLSVQLTSADGATIGQDTATVTITDDDPFVLGASSPEIREGTGGSTQATFHVALKSPVPPGMQVSVDYHVAGVTATIPDDLDGPAGTLTFGPGDQAQDVSVHVVGDAVHEPTEFFRLVLGSPIASPNRPVLIDDIPDGVIDDDDAANVAPAVTELEGQAAVDEDSRATYHVTASDPDGDALSYLFSVVSGNARIVTQTEASADVLFPDGPDDVTLRVDVSDGHDHQVTRTATVSVRDVAPTIDSLTLSGNTATACLTGNTVTLTATFSDPAGDADGYAGTIDWGDQTTSPFTASPVTATHAYVAGTYGVSVDVRDSDGLAAPQRRTAADAVALRYRASDFLQPINSDGSSVFTYGSTIPVKIRVTDCTGTSVSQLHPAVTWTLVNSATPSSAINEAVSTSAADSGNQMRYSTTDQQYIFNMATTPLPDGDASYILDAGDPSFGHVSQRIGLRRK